MFCIIAVDGTDGQRVIDTSPPIKISLSIATLGCIMNVLATPLTHERGPMSATAEVLETGIKVVDRLAPYACTNSPKI
ncbi:hypothetical protein QCA50_019099 [Cerrena zonata]|uniref:Uncharacterized protein n=1 Tax=Cerrena zonata TaxID=2478898 RepID=A0AAW0FEN5_9APHY